MKKNHKEDNYRWQKVCLFLTIVTVASGSIMGFVIPLRPVKSEIEKRTLSEFPDISAEKVIDGQFFSDVSTWYSDTFPLRDLWMQGNNSIKTCYGIKTKQVITASDKGDDIPDIVKPNLQETASEETSSKETASKETVTAETSTAAMETSQTNETIGAITGQQQNGLYIEGDTAYGMYFFNSQAASTYIDVVNRTAKSLEGVSNVYAGLVPLSEVYHLNDEQRASLEPDWKNEYSAIEYYYGSMLDSVKKIPIYEKLDEHKNEYIYFRSDHHWNGLGAYYAYEAFAETKGIQPHSRQEYTVMNFPDFLGSYYSSSQSAALEANPDTVQAFVPITCNLMTFVQEDGTQLQWNIINDVSTYNRGNKYSCFAAGDNPFSYIDNPDAQGNESCVIIKESYADAFVPFLTDHYRYIYWFDYRSYNGSIMDFIRENNINDVIFLNGLEPISSVAEMNRLSSIMGN